MTAAVVMERTSDSFMIDTQHRFDSVSVIDFHFSNACQRLALNQNRRHIA